LFFILGFYFLVFLPQKNTTPFFTAFLFYCKNLFLSKTNFLPAYLRGFRGAKMQSIEIRGTKEQSVTVQSVVVKEIRFNKKFRPIKMIYTKVQIAGLKQDPEDAKMRYTRIQGTGSQDASMQGIELAKGIKMREAVFKKEVDLDNELKGVKTKVVDLDKNEPREKSKAGRLTKFLKTRSLRLKDSREESRAREESWAKEESWSKAFNNTPSTLTKEVSKIFMFILLFVVSFSYLFFRI
jgi:hypothetical protein